MRVRSFKYSMGRALAWLAIGASVLLFIVLLPPISILFVVSAGAKVNLLLVVVAAFGLLGVGLTLHALSEPPEPHGPRSLRCMACGYDLRGTPDAGVCPECGRSP